MKLNEMSGEQRHQLFDEIIKAVFDKLPHQNFEATLLLFEQQEESNGEARDTVRMNMYHSSTIHREYQPGILREAANILETEMPFDQFNTSVEGEEP